MDIKWWVGHSVNFKEVHVSTSPVESWEKEKLGGLIGQIVESSDKGMYKYQAMALLELTASRLTQRLLYGSFRGKT